jgi:hypothetical protein
MALKITSSGSSITAGADVQNIRATSIFTDPSSKKALKYVTASDSFGLSDSVVVNTAFHRIISDQIQLTDSQSIARNSVEETATDGVSFAESLTFDINKALTDSITFTESLAFAFDRSRHLTDDVALTDTHGLGVGTTKADGLTFSETVVVTYQASNSRFNTTPFNKTTLNA